MGKRSRDKGARGEREAAEVLRPIFPEVRRRAMQARGGAEGADLDNTPGYHVEVGCGRVNPRVKWEQAEVDATESKLDMDGRLTLKGDTPIALTRKDRGPWLVTQEVGAWMELVRKARRADELQLAWDVDRAATKEEQRAIAGEASVRQAKEAERG